MNDVLNYQTRIRQKLVAAFAPSLLEIKDDSKKHAGHAGHHAEGETHFAVMIVSEKFAGLGLLARHRLVYDALKDELAERVHALNISAKTAAEHQK
jgi:BolA protein